ncbi:hypothetical protein Hanom_Chr04g00341031 [Helianthus anomalus]
MADQRKLDIEASHNQAGYLLDPPTKYYEEFNYVIVGLNSCWITHALKVNPIISSDTVRGFWLIAKVNRSGPEGATSLGAKVQEKDIVITEVVIRKYLTFGDQTHHPTSFRRDRVVKALRKMSYEGECNTS